MVGLCENFQLVLRLVLCLVSVFLPAHVLRDSEENGRAIAGKGQLQYICIKSVDVQVEE
jgi:hypothetical protein